MQMEVVDIRQVKYRRRRPIVFPLSLSLSLSLLFGRQPLKQSALDVIFAQQQQQPKKNNQKKGPSSSRPRAIW